MSTLSGEGLAVNQVVQVGLYEKRLVGGLMESGWDESTYSSKRGRRTLPTEDRSAWSSRVDGELTRERGCGAGGRRGSRGEDGHEDG